MCIKYEKVLGEWVIWKKDKNALFEVFRAKTKKECQIYMKKKKKSKRLLNKKI